MSNSDPEVELDSMNERPPIKSARRFHFFCKANHWEINSVGQLILHTPQGQQKDAVRKLVSIIEMQVRQLCHAEIMAHNFTANRKQLIRNGIEQIPATIQRLIADGLLTKYLRSPQGSKDETVKGNHNVATTLNISTDGSSIASKGTSTDTNKEGSSS